MMDKLNERRVRNIIEPLILGEDIDELSADFLYTRDLGIIRNNNGKIEPANPLYAELIIRTLNWSTQRSIEKNHEPVFFYFLPHGDFNHDVYYY
jgi:hypothetical protein